MSTEKKQPEVWDTYDNTDRELRNIVKDHFNDIGFYLDDLIAKKYNEPWRFYHNLDHANGLAYDIKERQDEYSVFDKYEEAIVAAYFHDIIYHPSASDNEEKSIEFYEQVCEEYNREPSKDVINMIRGTKYGELPDEEWVDYNVKVFYACDRAILYSNSISDLIDYEKKIMKEFQFVDYSTYKKKRLEFFDSVIANNFEWHIPMIPALREYIQNKRPKVGIYAGSFNPFHIGHLDILKQAEKDFDKVIIAIGKNPEKEQPERKKDVQDSVVYRQVEEFDGLLTDFMEEQKEECDVTLIRGLRNGHDLEYEMNQLRFMEEVADERIPTVYYVCDPAYSHISSSAIRNLKQVAPEKAKEYLVNNNE